MDIVLEAPRGPVGPDGDSRTVNQINNLGDEVNQEEEWELFMLFTKWALVFYTVYFLIAIPMCLSVRHWYATRGVDLTLAEALARSGDFVASGFALTFIFGSVFYGVWETYWAGP